MLEHVVFSNRIPSIFPCSSEVGCARLGDCSCGLLSPGSKSGQGPSLHVHRGRATEGNGLQVTGQKISEESESERLFLKSGDPIVSDSSCSRWWRMHGVQKLRDRGSLNSFVEEPGSLRKETMACRQSGQGMEPGGIDDSEGMLLVEQRYRPHLTQSSCPQPVKYMTSLLLKNKIST